MRAVLQRVTFARVTIGAKVVGRIDRGLVVLVGISKIDGPSDVLYLVKKVCGLRIFQDREGRINRSLKESGGSILVVSQSTVYGDCRKGHRPSYAAAAAPEVARKIYEDFVRSLRRTGVPVQTGEFQEMMQVEIINDGPVTLLLESSRTF